MDFLADPAAHGGAPVTRIDTHAASVFLAGDRALKIKRAVRFPFLDYSTLAKRKARLRGRDRGQPPFAPAIYRGVVAITREAGGAPRHRRRGRAGGMGGGDAPLRRERRRSIIWPSAARIDDALADALGRAVAQGACGGAGRQGCRLRRGAGRDHRAERCRARRRARRCLRPPQVEALEPGDARGASRACGRCSKRASARAASRAATATCISAISCCSTASRRCSTPSSSIPSSPPATCSTISPSCSWT